MKTKPTSERLAKARAQADLLKLRWQVAQNGAHAAKVAAKKIKQKLKTAKANAKRTRKLARKAKEEAAAIGKLYQTAVRQWEMIEKSNPPTTTKPSPITSAA
jgi:hypothetical protein